MYHVHNSHMMSLGYHVISTSIGHQKRTFDAPINAHQWRNSVSLFVCDNCNMVGCYGDIIYGLCTSVIVKVED